MKCYKCPANPLAEYLLSSFFGKRSRHGLAGALQDRNRWKSYCKKVILHLEKYIEANLRALLLATLVTGCYGGGWGGGSPGWSRGGGSPVYSNNYYSNNVYRGYGSYPQPGLFDGYAPAHEAWAASTRGRTSYGREGAPGGQHVVVHGGGGSVGHSGGTGGGGEHRGSSGQGH
jgi:hypothetical protein